MKCDDGKVGFIPPRDGLHTFAITDAKYDKLSSRDKSKDYKVVTLKLEVQGDGEEHGKSIQYKYFVENQMGRLDMAKMLYFAKVSAPLEKACSIPAKDADLNVEQWADKFLNPEDSRCEKVLSAAVNMMVGRSFDAKLTGVKDDKGVNYRLEYFFVGEGTKAEKKGSGSTATAAAATASASAAAAPEEAPW